MSNCDKCKYYIVSEVLDACSAPQTFYDENCGLTTFRLLKSECTLLLNIINEWDSDIATEQSSLSPEIKLINKLRKLLIRR